MRDVTCTPLHATILHHFGERRRWPLKELAAALGVSRDLTKRKLGLWLNRGFVTEVPLPLPVPAPVPVPVSLP